MNGLKKVSTEIVEKARSKPKMVRAIISAIFVVALLIVVIWAVLRISNYSKIEEERNQLQATLSEKDNALSNANQELKSVSQELETTTQELGEVQGRLTYEEEQVKLLEESTNALIGQVDGLKKENENLSNQLEELLNVKDTVPKITRNVLETQVNSLSELVTSEFWYRNASQKESSKTWLWGWTMPFSDASLLATYDGVITTSVDLKQIKFQISESTKTITVTMPPSKIFDHNIPQETINVLAQKDGLFNKIDFNDYNQFIAAEKPVMEQVAIERGLLTKADEEAQEVVEAFLKTIPGMDVYTLKFAQAQ